MDSFGINRRDKLDPLVMVYLIGAGLVALIVCGGVAVVVMLTQSGV